MAQRKRIGLTFSYNEEWIAGSYYILNIIHALKVLPNSVRPEIFIISEEKKNFDIVKEETKYPHLNFFQFPIKKPAYTIFERGVNKIGRVFGRKKLINKKPKKLNIDFVYPFEVENLSSNPLKKVNWIPDFQEVHLPRLFSEEARAKRKKHQEEIVCKGDWVVFSSKDSQNDFNNLYPHSTAQQYVLPFAVTHPNFDTKDFQKLLEKYSLPKNYYLVPNQFWAHKNHMVILKTLTLLKDDSEIFIAFSGKDFDHRNKGYVTVLKKYIKDNNLEENVSFLGFLDRKEQLIILKKAIAVIQPSLFEGWSTVVEDVKALNQFIILSDLAVHHEQIKVNCEFFQRENEEELASLLKKYILSAPKIELSNHYGENIHKFGQDFMQLIDLATQ